ncbi:SDR family oxidoreductase, partial [Candidatus Pelagibacter sp. HIMB1506]|uniref:SDR family oxidoreductase n=1 Tax=Candidatus Pelagibacter sp. HIMB1506 TaxID=3413337 RepID=UPI003F85B194
MISIGITGSTGILGKNLIYFLKKNKKFKINQFLDDISNNKKINNWINKNQFDIIVHLAAIVPTKKVNKNYKEAKKINVDGTKNLINSIKKYQISKPFLFFSSSSHVYSFSRKIISEQDLTKGINKYGKTKLLAEKILLKNSKFYDLCIGRISSLTSENQNNNFLINKIIDLGKRKKKIFFKNSNIKRNFIYVDDVSKIIVKIIKKKLTGIFNISSSEITHLSKLFKYLEKKYKFKIKYYSKDEEYLIISNKLLIKKIGIFN